MTINLFKLNATDKILSFRIRWYRENFLAFLRRYQHALLLLVFLFIPLAGSSDLLFAVLFGISKPIMNVFAQDTSFSSKFLALFCLQGGYIIWLLIQRNAVVGNPLTQYLMSLPMSQQQHWRVHLSVIVRANNITWLIFVASFMCIFMSEQSSLVIIYSIFNIIALACLVLLAQVLWLYRSVSLFIILFVVDTLYLIPSSFLVNITVTLSTFMMMPLLLFLTVFLMALLLHFPRLFSCYLSMKVGVNTHKQCKASVLAADKPIFILPILRVYLRLLFDSYFFTTIFRFVLGLLLSFLMIVILRQSGLSLSFDFSIVFVSAISFIVSETFSVLSAERKKIVFLLMPLPVRFRFWVMLDSFIVYFMSILMAFPGILFAYVKQMIGPTDILGICIYLLLLMSILFFVRNQFDKQGTTLSGVVCIAGSLIGFLY